MLPLKVGEVLLNHRFTPIPFAILALSIDECLLDLLYILFVDRSGQQLVDVLLTLKIDIPADHFLGVLEPLLGKLVFQIFGEGILEFC